LYFHLFFSKKNQLERSKCWGFCWVFSKHWCSLL